MNKTGYLILASVLALALSGCDKISTIVNKDGDNATEKSEVAVTLGSQQQKISYIMGMNIGSQFKTDDFTLDLVAFNQGITDALSEAEPRLSDEEAAATIEAFQQEQTARQDEVRKEQENKNMQEGVAFLAENAKKDGVTVLPSGLHYRVITDGSGPIPTADNTVEVNYRGTLIDGTEFDSSYKRGVPAQFGVTQVIPGWVEALQLMKEGSKWELVVPPELAYGPGGAGGLIGPNQTLIFEVELLKAAVVETAE